MNKLEIAQKKEVRFEIQIALSPLFLPVKDTRDKERPKRTVRRETANGWIEFSCYEQLCTFDESVALAILRIASDRSRGYALGPCPKTDFGKEMRELIDPENFLPEMEFGLIRETSIHEIAVAMGNSSPGKDNYKAIRASLRRLSRVMVSQRDDITGTETHGDIGFIKHRILDNDRLAIVITRRLALAVFGTSGWVYAIVDLNERNSLGTDIAKSAHRYLAAWMWNEKKKNVSHRTIKLDTLAKHIWPTWENYSQSGQRTLRNRLKEAILSLNSLPSWTTTVEGRGTKAISTVSRC